LPRGEDGPGEGLQARIVRASTRKECDRTMTEAILGVLAMTPRSPGGEQPNFLFSLIPFALIFVMFYFLLIAPARKKQKKHTEMMGNLKPGDRVITNGGIHGTVAGVSDHVVQIKIADQVKIEISKNAVAGLQAEPQ